MTGALASVSVDLDPVRCYGAIHALGVSPAPPPREDPIYLRGVPRYRSLFDALGLRATFFVVARDLQDRSVAQAVLALAADGHEIASHSLDHLYDLVRLPHEAMREQVEGAASAIATVLGSRPLGFRAPGYTMTDELAATVARSGARYDASVFPCPAYFAAKAAVVGAMRALGRRSASVLGSPAVLGAPAEPYRMGRPYTACGDGLLEIPIGVTARARLPFLGTALVLAGPGGSRWLAAAMRPRAFASLERHGIDLCDARDDGFGQLAARQLDLRVGLDRKRSSLTAAIRQLAADGRRFVRLDAVQVGG